MIEYPSHRRLAGKLISQEPKEFYDVLQRPVITRLSTAVEDYLWKGENSPAMVLLTDQTSWDVVKAANALNQSVRDVSFMTYAALSAPDKRLQNDARSLSHLFTTAILGLAMLPQEEVGTYYHAQGRKIVKGITASMFAQDAYAITQAEREAYGDFERGCPFAGEYKPTPLFSAFVRWSTALAINAYDAHPVIEPTEAISAFQAEYLAVAATPD